MIGGSAVGGCTLAATKAIDAWIARQAQSAASRKNGRKPSRGLRGLFGDDNGELQPWSRRPSEATYVLFFLSSLLYAPLLYGTYYGLPGLVLHAAAEYS